MGEVAVADRGIGIDAVDAGRIFEKYGRVDDPYVERTAGVGLGLYLTRLILHANGGTVAVESAGRGHGSTFRVRLPLRAASPVIAVSEGRARA